MHKTSKFCKFIIVFVLFLFSAVTIKAQNNPVANVASVVKAGKARFTVLTAGLIRMEWDTTGIFEDNATQVVINRKLNKAEFTVSETPGKLIIKTTKLQLEYIKGNKHFDATNLKITPGATSKENYTWNLAVKDTGNLKGTSKTLDNYNGDVAEADFKTRLELENGLLSKSGWFLLDDAKTYELDNSALPWVKEKRSYSAQDFYFFSYGNDYKSILYDYTLIAGKVPLPPRYAFGYWWSRYYAYSDDELRGLVAKFNQHKVPLDVLVIDMDWHPSLGAYEKSPKRDLSGSRRGWTGYTWDKRLFPDPADFLKWTEQQELKVTLNLHPASGIPYTEDKYAKFAKIMDFDTTGVSARKTEADNVFATWPVFDPISYKDILYEGSDKKYMTTLFNLVLHPLEKQGVDFWWLDWQQYKYSKVYRNLDNTWWLNHVFFSEMQQQHKARPIIYHRWGGLGNHRYQIGFSGDATITWKTLAYEPFFTATASNVLYGYWSHDIGGHLKTKDTTENKDLAVNPELYTRWIQYGVFSPILRTHSTQGLVMSREPWEFASKYSDIIKSYINLRYALAPYIYTMARKTYDTGISLCRPLYYEHPEDKESYQNKTQYFFGDNILVAPIGAPSQNDISTVRLWLPKANWVNLFTGETIKGQQTIQRRFKLDEYPVFVKQGAIIPSYPNVKNLKHNSDTIILKIFGQGNTESELYEDGGDDDLYRSGFYTKRKFIGSTQNDHIQRLRFLPAKGEFKGMQKEKFYFVDFYGAKMPSKVKLNGKILFYSSNHDKTPGWEYLAADVALRVRLPKVKSSDLINIEVAYPANNIDVNGLQGKIKKAKSILVYLRANQPIGNIPSAFFTAGNLALNLGYQPNKFEPLVNEFLTIYDRFEVMIQGLNIDVNQKNHLVGLLKI